MSRTVDLWHYLPDFLKDFRELNILFDAEQPEFQLMAENTDGFCENLFIKTAHEEGLAAYEKILNIKPNAGDDLESRRNVVLSRWYDAMPFTVRALKARIGIIQGNDDVQVFIDPDDPFLLHTICHMEQPGQIETLTYILSSMVPANMNVDSRNMIQGTVPLTMTLGVGASVTGSLFLTNDLIGDVKTTFTQYASVGASVTGTLNIVNA